MLKAVLKLHLQLLANNSSFSKKDNRLRLLFVFEGEKVFLDKTPLQVQRARTIDFKTDLLAAGDIELALSTMNCQIWSLEKYARMTSEPVTPTVSKDGWQHFTNQSEKLDLTITSTHQFMIHHGRKQMMSLSLASASESIKGVSLGDSLMVVYKVQGRSHRFRVKFSSTPTESGEERCCACVNKLSQYFTIKLSDTSVTGTSSQQQVSCTPETVTVLSGDVTIGQLSQALVSNSVKLPELYAEMDGSNIDLGTLIKLCLTDTSFPAFVGQVEGELEKINTQCL